MSELELPDYIAIDPSAVLAPWVQSYLWDRCKVESDDE